MRPRGSVARNLSNGPQCAHDVRRGGIAGWRPHRSRRSAATPLGVPPESACREPGRPSGTARTTDRRCTATRAGVDPAPELLPLRYGRMTASPWTYFRGAAAVMAADLAGSPHSGLTGADVRRRARPELRSVGHPRAQPGLRAARLRRDAAGTVRVGRQAPRDQPGRGRPGERAPRPGRARRGPHLRDRRTASGCAGTRADQLAIWYDAIHVEELLAHFERRPEDAARG